MEISSTSTAAVAARIEPTVDPKRAQLQALLLRKMLDSRKSQAEEMTRSLEGKGQVLDVRV